MQILDAARAVLLESGIEGTTIEAIATLAELSVGTIYVYFNNKEEIFAALQEEGIGILQEMMTDAIKTSSHTHARLMSIADVYYTFRVKNAKYFDILNYFLTSPRVVFPDHLKRRVDELGGVALNVLEHTIIRGIENKEIECRNPRECAIAFWALLHGVLQFWKIRKTMLGIEDFKQLYFSVASHFINSLKKR